MQTGDILILICVSLYTTSSLTFLTFRYFNKKKKKEQRDDTTSGEPFPVTTRNNMQGGCCSFVLAREAFEMLVLGVIFTPIELP
jgi:hypothetical protein